MSNIKLRFSSIKAKTIRSASALATGALLIWSVWSGMAVPLFAYAQTAASFETTPAFSYSFSTNGTLVDAATPETSTSPYWWLLSGGQLVISGGAGSTVTGSLSLNSPIRTRYAASLAQATDNGFHPQNVFRLLTKNLWDSVRQDVKVTINSVNLFNTANVEPYNGISLINRYQDDNNFYIATVRMDGSVVIKKKLNGTYYTLGSAKFLSGTYNAVKNPSLLIPGMTLRLRDEVVTNTDGTVGINVYNDATGNGTWKLIASAVDNGTQNGAVIKAAGRSGIFSDYLDLSFDNYAITKVASISTTPSTTSTTPPSTPTSAPTPPPSSSPSSYDSSVLADSPALYLAMSSPSSGTEADKSGHGLSGTYHGTPTTTTLPNGDTAANFNGTNQYLSVPSASSLSVPTTGEFTWEGWIKTDFSYPAVSSDGYVDWMGKCANYSPTCEWEARIYGNSTAEGRPDRLSAYIFNPSAGLGSAADWQPASNLPAGKWVYVVAEYQTKTTPSGCNSAYPGSINIWVDGIKQNAAAHLPTGCMSQYQIIPKANNSPLTIGTLALDTFFEGAIGKVAVYDHLLTQTDIDAHYRAMTGLTPAGSCGATCTITNPVP